jgi:hypothetical protein
MGVHAHNGTMPGAVTPICNNCMIALCFDIGEQEYKEDKEFWDNWVCRDCNGGEPLSRHVWRQQHIQEGVSV